ncbi:hypothetical protein NOR_00490 [Metarhizium rileyi]|uniref:Uncharacterized protein n=1 Tax=Metarhizium rileyi (strain RCEF 4871) TaxID=1649241 RepID=A0A167KLX7_METRR|nr:hypothetical protein NOR_00490 [Metarhizium rileyi RCEF 4871]
MDQHQQPDFAAAARALEVVVDNVKLCSNIPAVDNGAAIGRMIDARMDALDARMNARMDAMMEFLEKKLGSFEQKLGSFEQKLGSIEQKLGSIEQKLDGMDCKFSTLDKNSRARAINSAVIRPSMELVPMYNIWTGDEITGCPATLRALDELPVSELSRLLRELGETVPRAERDERRLVKQAFGIINGQQLL